MLYPRFARVASVHASRVGAAILFRQAAKVEKAHGMMCDENR